MLDSIGRKYGTDKSSLHHNYLTTYEQYLRPLRDSSLNLLEIGFGGYKRRDEGGESIRTWHEYFPNANITCLEIYPKDFKLDRVTIVQGSQCDQDDLEKLAAEHGPFDIIIDDGSHISEHIIVSFLFLFNNALKDGGLYIVEDTSTAWEPDMAGETSSIEFFKGNINLYNHHHHNWDFQKMSPFLYIHFYNQLIITQKGRSSII